MKISAKMPPAPTSNQASIPGRIILFLAFCLTLTVASVSLLAGPLAVPGEVEEPAVATPAETAPAAQAGEAPESQTPAAESLELGKLKEAEPTWLGGSCHADCFEVYQECTTSCVCDHPWCGAPCFQQCSLERNICSGACSN